MSFSSTLFPDLFTAVMHFISQFFILEFFRFTLGPLLCRVDAFSLKVRLEKGQLCLDDVLDVLDFLFRHPFRLSLFLANAIYRAGSVFSCVQFMAACGTLLKSARERGSDLSPLQKLLVLCCVVILLYLHLSTILNILNMLDHLQFVLFTFFWILFTSNRKGRRMFAFLKLDGMTLLKAMGLEEMVRTEVVKMKRKGRKQSEETEDEAEERMATVE